MVNAKILAVGNESPAVKTFEDMMTLVVGNMKKKYSWLNAGRYSKIINILPKELAHEFSTEIGQRRIPVEDIKKMAHLILTYYLRQGTNSALSQIQGDIRTFREEKTKFCPLHLFFNLTSDQLQVLTLNKDHNDLLKIFRKVKEKADLVSPVNWGSIISEEIAHKVGSNLEYTIRHYFDEKRNCGPSTAEVIIGGDKFIIKRMVNKPAEANGHETEWYRIYRYGNDQPLQEIADADQLDKKKFSEATRQAISNKIQLLLPHYIYDLFEFLSSNYHPDFHNKDFATLLEKYVLKLFRSKNYRKHFPARIGIYKCKDLDRTKATVLLANIYNIFSVLIKKWPEDQAFCRHYYRTEKDYAGGEDKVSIDALELDLSENFLHRKIKGQVSEEGNILKVDVPHSQIISKNMAQQLFSRVYPENGKRFQFNRREIDDITSQLKTRNDGKEYFVELWSSNGFYWNTIFQYKNRFDIEANRQHLGKKINQMLKDYFDGAYYYRIVLYDPKKVPINP